MKKTGKMKIYALVFGALAVYAASAQTAVIGKTIMSSRLTANRRGPLSLPYSVRKGDCSLSLDGTWKFRWTPVPEERIPDFYRTDFDDGGWTDFEVPANWEINGYGTPIYVSAGYPFKIDPPRVTESRKPVIRRTRNGIRWGNTAARSFCRRDGRRKDRLSCVSRG